MTFEELDRQFPNGLDDAEITGISIGYSDHTATILIGMRGNPPDHPDRDVYAPAALMLRGVFYFSIEPPDDDHVLGREKDKITVDGFSEDEEFPLFRHVKSKLPPDAFCCRFFVHDWNSFIHLASAEATFHWQR